MLGLAAMHGCGKNRHTLLLNLTLLVLKQAFELLSWHVWQLHSECPIVQEGLP